MRHIYAPLERSYRAVAALEWIGRRLEPGVFVSTSPEVFRACPSCGGVKPSDRASVSFEPGYIGHRDDCELWYALLAIPEFMRELASMLTPPAERHQLVSHLLSAAWSDEDRARLCSALVDQVRRLEQRYLPASVLGHFTNGYEGAEVPRAD